MDQVGETILIKLIQCILQSRINVEKKQIRHFDQVNKQLHSLSMAINGLTPNKQITKNIYNFGQSASKIKYQYGDNYINNLKYFLQSLLLAQKYSIKDHIYHRTKKQQKEEDSQKTKQKHYHGSKYEYKHKHEQLQKQKLGQKHEKQDKKDEVRSNYQSITIIFRLANNLTKKTVDAEIWNIQFTQYHPIDSPVSTQHKQIQQKKPNQGLHITRQMSWQHQSQGQERSKVIEGFHEQEFSIITTIFQQLLLFLNRQPLFSDYQRNRDLKNSYSITYQIINNSKPKSSKQSRSGNKSAMESSKQYSILDIQHKHAKYRICNCLSIKLQCYYLPKFDSLLESINNRMPVSGKIQPENQKNRHSESQQNSPKLPPSAQEKARKTSFYQFYDKQLDFVFLASDDEIFKGVGKNKYKEEVKLTQSKDESDDDQFQLLIMNKDEEFVADNKGLFAQYSKSQQQYL